MQRKDGEESGQEAGGRVMRCVNIVITAVRVPVGSLKLDHCNLIRTIKHPAVLTIP